MRLAFADLLHHSQQRDRAVEVAPAVVRAWRGGRRDDGYAELVEWRRRGVDRARGPVGDGVQLVTGRGCALAFDGRWRGVVFRFVVFVIVSVLTFGLGKRRCAGMLRGFVAVGEEGEGGTVTVGVDELIDLGVCEEFEDEGEIVGVEEELC